MAMVKCSECNHEVSSSAKTCPACGADLRSRTTAKAWLVIALMALGIIIYFPSGGPGGDAPLSARYPGPWRDDFHLGISRALAANHIRGCGQLKYRESSEHGSEFLVYCTSDGSTWTAYLVWPNIGEVNGPYGPDASLR